MRRYSACAAANSRRPRGSSGGSGFSSFSLSAPDAFGGLRISFAAASAGSSSSTNGSSLSICASRSRMDARHCASNVLRVERAGGGRTGDEVSEERSGGWLISTRRELELGGSGPSRAGERDVSRNAARGSGDPRRARARVLTRATCLRLPRRGLDPRRPCLARPARLPIWLSLASGARERAREPTCAPRADFARKKAKRFRALTRRQATVGVDVAHTRARDRFGHTRQTRGRRDARSARAGPIDGETRGGTRDVRRSAVLISKRSRARRFPEKKGIIVVARRGVPSRAGRDA